MKNKIPLLLLILLLPINLMAQNTFRIMGTVTDTYGEPLIGANVYIPALNAGAATDMAGKYVIELSKEIAKGQQVVLNVTYVGYKAQSVTLTLAGNSIQQDFVLEEDVFESETIVVTGIASKTSKAVAEVAVSRVPAAQLAEIQSYQGLSQLVSGKIAGVQVAPSSGNVGGGFRFFVRGGGGLNGDEQPVIYIDGIRVEDAEIEGYGVGGQGSSILANLNVQDIENIEVLKGPAAAAMYGTDGSNGVVLITTKSGKLGAGLKPYSITYKYDYGYNTQAYKFKKDRFESADRANGIYQDGLIRNHYVNFSGGTGVLRYYASYENRLENGILPNSSMDRSSVRLNLSAYPTEKLTFQLNSAFIFNDIQRPNNDNNIYGWLGNTLLRLWYFTDSTSVASIKDLNKNNQYLGSFKITWKPIENLELNAGVGIDDNDWRQDQIFPVTGSYSTINKGQKSIYNRHNRQFTYDLNARYNYDIAKELKGSSVIGSQILDSKVTTSFMSAENFGSQYIMNIGSGLTINEYDEGFSHLRQAGIYIDNNFSYKDQYFLTLAIRRDYASTIGENAPAITYPKVSLAVRMDKYDFFPEFFDLFKLRAAYGESGQLPGTDDAIPLLWQAYNGGAGIGGILNSIGNTNIEPERIKEFEIGFDTEFLNMFALEFTYFNGNAKNSIIYKNNPPSSGLTASTVPFNIGAMKNHGFETLLQINPIKGRDYNLDVNIIWNYQTNEVTDMDGQEIPDGFDVNYIKEGMKKHEFYTFKTVGARFDESGKYLGPQVSEDRVDLGNPIPDHTGSISFNFRFLKNFNLYALAEWGLNNKVYNLTRQFAIQFGNDTEYNILRAKLGLSSSHTEVTPLEVGSPEYKAAAEQYAKLSISYDGNFIEDADYFTVREVSLSYDFTELFSQYLHTSTYLQRVVVGFSVRNLLKLTKYSGADYELNFDGGRSLSRGSDFLTLQNPRTYTFWVQLGL
ncbi:TonB-dependent receptor domain-containing protein [Melioribacter sp. OK-6-Me]|uniref:TonB-dependent receptor domain-containing protein n=1 Tax=unclassified Melioribacter TaxID=2627329 RepID=UPI003ED92929